MLTWLQQLSMFRLAGRLSNRCAVVCQRAVPRRALATATVPKSTQLKRLLTSPQLEFLMEAHSGLSARIVEEAGFKGIWASGLSISASMGLRDSNEASWTQVLEVLDFMVSATSIPILMDADTGFG